MTTALSGICLLVKPAGPDCNLRCSYCFYREKASLFPETRKHRMKASTLELLVSQALAAARDLAIFSWQGGEPTLAGLDFFERVVELQKKHARAGQRIHNALQTNATLLDDEWARFLKRNRFLVGVSIDGPEPLHDAHRVDRDGAGSFDSVMAGIERLARHGVEFNTLTCIHRHNARHPLRVYRFLRDQGSRFMQFIPIVEPTLRMPQGGQSHFRCAKIGTVPKLFIGRP